MASWLRAREEFADNRFQLLFIYIDIDSNSPCENTVYTLIFAGLKFRGFRGSGSHLRII